MEACNRPVARVQLKCLPHPGLLPRRPGSGGMASWLLQRSEPLSLWLSCALLKGLLCRRHSWQLSTAQPNFRYTNGRASTQVFLCSRDSSTDGVACSLGSDCPGREMRNRTGVMFGACALYSSSMRSPECLVNWVYDEYKLQLHFSSESS